MSRHGDSTSHTQNVCCPRCCPVEIKKHHRGCESSQIGRASEESHSFAKQATLRRIQTEKSIFFKTNSESFHKKNRHEVLLLMHVGRLTCFIQRGSHVIHAFFVVTLKCSDRANRFIISEPREETMKFELVALDALTQCEIQV